MRGTNAQRFWSTVCWMILFFSRFRSCPISVVVRTVASRSLLLNRGTDWYAMSSAADLVINFMKSCTVRKRRIETRRAIPVDAMYIGYVVGLRSPSKPLIFCMFPFHKFVCSLLSNLSVGCVPLSNLFVNFIYEISSCINSVCSVCVPLSWLWFFSYKIEPVCGLFNSLRVKPQLPIANAFYFSMFYFDGERLLW